MNLTPIEPPDDPNSTSPLRLAVVTRRFWPFAGSTELAVGDLASAIKRAGHCVEIVTVRWEKNWPRFFQFLELPVHRVNRPASGPWGSFRYLRNLTRELTALQLDGIIVYGLGSEAWSITRSFADKIPITIRIDNHLLGDQPSPPQFSKRQVSALNVATHVVVESEWTANRIASHPAVKTEAISVVPDGVQISPDRVRTATDRACSRVAISDAHPILMIEAGQPLVVCGAPLNGDKGLFDLLDAWPRVLKRFPNARLWILGDGTNGRKIWDRIQEKNLVHSVILPGSFDDLTDVFQAADVYVHPLRSNETCSFLSRALAAGVCPIATSTDSTRQIITHEVNGLLVEAQNPKALSDAVIVALDDVDLREGFGSAVLKPAVTTYDVDQLVDQFLEPHLPDPDSKPVCTAITTRKLNS